MGQQKIKGIKTQESCINEIEYVFINKTDISSINMFIIVNNAEQRSKYMGKVSMYTLKKGVP